MKKYYIGIDLGGTNIKTAIFTDTFSKIDEIRTTTEAEKGSDFVLEKMLKQILSLLDRCQISTEEISCLGIGVPGLMDRRAGISVFSPNFTDWENVPVSAWFENKLQLKTLIDNDVRVNLYGEWYFGAGKGKQNLVLLTLGTGLGSGVVIDGHVLYGATDSVGEIGHMNIYRTGRPCRCGSSGCLGRYVSALGLIRTVREKIESGAPSLLNDWTQCHLERLTAEMISNAYDQNDSVAQEAMRETGEILGFGLTNLINLYNPEMIIIGGGMASAGERLLASARTVVRQHALQLSQNACEIVTASLGDSAGMLGAAVYASNCLKQSAL